ncbi:NAD(P)H-dependent glycerol-3-phosphate dehydrogenase [Lacticigenium naphthae]|uniref:NAD(P)H-dependent glycerol-3-phosphate dehydrogenase n=1 Tax=Lacticigenium naphthae TaxID=515351 RepID=UPI00041E21C9|nr:NAD(P)H-dependent glycerol-3-phosphate dehydrogenase [Lacticigenium naphthae]
MKKTITVLGAGSWGTALATVLQANGHIVRLWGNNTKQIKEINEKHTNTHYLKNFTVPKEIKATVDLKEALADTDAILFVVPTGAMRSVAQQVQALLTEPKLIIHASKGLEQNTYLRISEILSEEIPAAKRKAIVALSGPSHAEEVAKKDLTTITAASTDSKAAIEVQELFMNDYFRVYTNKDIVGVELGAALKNIIAIGAGALHGLGFGDNAKAALMTRGLAEISRLGVAFGADPITFLGLSGVGDLIVTCTSIHSRNWRAGNMLGKGKNLDTVLDEMGMIVEGVYTTKAVYEMAQEKEIDMPITTAIYNVLYKDADVKDTVLKLMQREGKSE